MVASATAQGYTLTRSWTQTLSNWDSLPQGLGGWSLDVNDVYDLAGHMIRLGDGSSRSLADIPPTIQTVAGTGASTVANGNGTSATSAAVVAPTSVAFAGDGSIYVVEGQSCVRKITGGIIDAFAGQCGSPGFSGDGGAASSAKLNAPQDVAVGPDGSVYIADTGNHRIRRVNAAGMIQTLAGNGTASWSGDGQNASLATLSSPSGVDVGPNSVVYIADTGNNRIRSITADGIIRAIAGSGASSSSGNEGAALAAGLGGPTRVRVGLDGSLFVAEPNGNVVRRVAPDGIIHGFAGVPVPIGYAGDGGQANAALLRSPMDVAVRPDGGVVIVDQNNTVRAVSPNGMISTIAGSNRSSAYSGDAGLAASSTFALSRGIRVAADGNIYIACTADNRVRMIGSAFRRYIGPAQIAFEVPSEDGRRIDQFLYLGSHMSTMDALTRQKLLTFSYSGLKLITVKDADGNLTQFNRDGAGNLTSIVAPFGQTTNIGLDSNGYLKSATDPTGAISSFVYDANGLMKSKTNAKGVANYSYDSLGRLQQDLDAASGPTGMSRSDAAGSFTVTQSSPTGVISTFQTALKPDGSFTRLNSAPGGLSSSLTFSRSGVMTTVAPDGTRTASTQMPDPQYGMLSPVQSIRTVLPSGTARAATMARATTRAPDGTLTSMTESTNLNGNLWLRSFNPASNTWTSTSPLGRQTTLTVDAAGRETSFTVPGITPRTTSYDSSGRLSAITQGIRNSAFDYFATGDAQNGYLKTSTNSLSQVTTYTRDGLGRELTEAAPDASLTAFSWDALDDLASVTPPGKPAHSQDYSPVGLLKQYTPPSITGVPNSNTTYTYDLDRNPKKITRPDGKTIDYGYDSDGRLITTTAATGVRALGYAVGHPSTLSDSTDGISLAYAFDGSLQKSVTWSGGLTGKVTWEYNSDFHRSREYVTGVQPGVADAYFAYDNDGLLVCASPTSCSPAGTDAMSISRSATNGRIESTQLNTVLGSYSYNDFGELLYEGESVGGVGVFSEYYDHFPSGLRDSLGRVKYRTERLQGVSTVFSYTYDSLGRLATAKQGSAAPTVYSYDSNGNRTGVSTSAGAISASYDAQDRLLTYGTFTYVYNANGELQSKTDSAAGKTTSYQYDVFGNLKRVDLPSGDVIQYLVDGENRRVAKKKNGVFVRRWIYRDELHPVEELDASGNQLKRFVYVTGKNSPDFMVQAGVEYRILSDQLGSPRLVVNASNGAVAQRMRHDEFGVVLEDTNAGFTPFGFAGGLYDADTGLVRFGARDYDPVVGRWVSKDPILFSGGQANLYVYVGNDPINRTDPSGLICGVDDAVEIAAGAAVLAGAAIYGILAGNPKAVDQTISWVKDAVTPTAPSGPKSPPKDCEEICGQYLGPGRTYVSDEGNTYSNDRYGNAQYAFYKCLEECEAAK